MIGRLFKFHGGIKPDAHKNESAGPAIQRAPLPARLVVPLRQSPRAAATCMVEVGQRVLKGERIGEPEGVLGTAVHAPTSGTVVDIARHPMAHPSGLDTECVVIEPDGEERWIEHAPFDLHTASREASLAWLRDCGIVGLGGATFPSHVKLGKGSGIETLILNGAECEPWITCDDRLMRERAADILAGATILRELIGARELVIGIEDNKPEAIAAMTAAAAASAHGVKVVAVPALYPAGGEHAQAATVGVVALELGEALLHQQYIVGAAVEDAHRQVAGIAQVADAGGCGAVLVEVIGFLQGRANPVHQTLTLRRAAEIEQHHIALFLEQHQTACQRHFLDRQGLAQVGQQHMHQFQVKGPFAGMFTAVQLAVDKHALIAQAVGVDKPFLCLADGRQEEKQQAGKAFQGRPLGAGWCARGAGRQRTARRFYS